MPRIQGVFSLCLRGSARSTGAARFPRNLIGKGSRSIDIHRFKRFCSSVSMGRTSKARREKRFFARSQTGNPPPRGGIGLGGGVVAIADFSALAEHGIPDMFPKLRVAFIETAASWVPYLYAVLVAKKLRWTFLPIALGLAPIGEDCKDRYAGPSASRRSNP